MCEITGTNETGTDNAVLSAWDTVARRNPVTPDSIKAQRAALRALCRVAPEDSRPDLGFLAESGNVTLEDGDINIDFNRMQPGELRRVVMSLTKHLRGNVVDESSTPCSCVVCRRGSVNE